MHMAVSKAVTRQVTNLRRLIAHHESCYRDTLIPEITDQQFDGLVQQLKRLETQYPELHMDEEVASDGQEDHTAVAHDIPMLSLDRTYDVADLARFLHRWDQDRADTRAILTPKLDGVALSLEYRDGLLVRALSRGRGGRVGYDVTSHVAHVLGILPTLSYRANATIRGELVVPKRARAAYLTRHPNASYSSCRAAAVAVLRSSEATLANELEALFVPYRAITDIGPRYRYQDELTWLQGQYFRALPWEPIAVSDIDAPDSLASKIAAWKDRRDRGELIYDIDGLVLTLDDFNARFLLGETAHHPRWAMAFKFPSEGTTATLLGLDYLVSKTGRITPVAIIEPLQLQGKTIPRLTLHSTRFLLPEGHREGDTLTVEMSGDVVGSFKGWLTHGQGNPLLMPTECPACHALLVMDDEGLSCPNRYLCDGQWVERLHHFVSPTGMHVRGLGKSALAQLVHAERIKQFSDLFTLTEDDLRPIVQGSSLRARRIVRHLHEAKLTTLPRFLVALGIDAIGPAVARPLASHFQQDLLAMLNVTDPAEFAQVPGISHRRAERLLTELARLRPDIERLLDLHVSWNVNSLSTR